MNQDQILEALEMSREEHMEEEDRAVERPWYFTNGIRYPKPVRVSKKTKRRLAKLMPYEDTRSDRITNQLMFVPNNYEDLKAKGKYKTILLYNGLGTWNVKEGEFFLLLMNRLAPFKKSSLFTF